MRTLRRQADDERQDKSEQHRPGGERRRSLDEEQIRAVYRFIYLHVGNREDAEELTGRACSLAVHDTRSLAFDGDDRDMEALLWQTARSVVAEHLRGFYGALAADNMPAGGTAASILAALPNRERDLLTLRFLKNVSLADAAATLRMTLHEAQALQWSALTDAAQLGIQSADAPCCESTHG